MQCYFAIKASLKADAKQKLYHLEMKLENPAWHLYVPTWFEPTAEDWRDIAMKTPFSNMRYALRVALIYRYFHHQFALGDY